MWAVVKVFDAEGKMKGYEIEKTIASSPARTTNADGSKKIVLKRFEAEAEAQKYQEKLVKALAEKDKADQPGAGVEKSCS